MKKITTLILSISLSFALALGFTAFATPFTPISEAHESDVTLPEAEANARKIIAKYQRVFNKEYKPKLKEVKKCTSAVEKLEAKADKLDILRYPTSAQKQTLKSLKKQIKSKEKTCNKKSEKLNKWKIANSWQKKMSEDDAKVSPLHAQIQSYNLFYVPIFYVGDDGKFGRGGLYEGEIYISTRHQYWDENTWKPIGIRGASDKSILDIAQHELGHSYENLFTTYYPTDTKQNKADSKILKSVFSNNKNHKWNSQGSNVVECSNEYITGQLFKGYEGSYNCAGVNINTVKKNLPYFLKDKQVNKVLDAYKKAGYAVNYSALQNIKKAGK